MLHLNLPEGVTRFHDLNKVDIQLRDAKDLLVICPPLSGLTSFIQQIVKHIRVSEHFRDHKVLYINLLNYDTSIDIIDYITSYIISEFSLEILTKKTSGKRLDLFFEFLSTDNSLKKLVIIIDNLNIVKEKDAKKLLENIRVIAESRNKNSHLRSVSFVLAGHSLDLRKLDPKHSSPFNIATQIYLDDLSSEESITLIKEHLSDKTVPQLTVEYIDFITNGHPYLIKHICHHIVNEDVKNDKPKGINFEVVDSTVEMLLSDKRDKITQHIDDVIKVLDPRTKELFKNVLNGYLYKSLKSSEGLRDLKLLGLINNNRSNRWHIRNLIFDSYIRNSSLLTGVAHKSNFIPRRMFVNIEGYKILFDLENNLREFVISKLFDAFGDEWGKIIERNSSLNSTVKGWELLKKNEQNISWLSHEDHPSLAFSLFPEIKTIIYEYWGGIFKPFFHPKTIFEGTFDSLEMLRNKIAHNRALSDEDIEKMYSIAKEFNDCMFENNVS